MSRFFRTNSDSESESESSDNDSLDSVDVDFNKSESEKSDSDSDSDGDKSGDEIPKTQAKKGPSRFLIGGTYSDDSDMEDEGGDDRKKRITSKKDKRYEEMENAVKSMENAQKIGDWVAISNEFDKLTKLISKSKNVLTESGKTPRFLIRALTQLEDFVAESLQKEKDAKKKMNPSNAKAFNAMKQKVKRYNKEYETEIGAFRNNPEEEEDDEEIVDEGLVADGSRMVEPDETEMRDRTAGEEDDDEDNNGFVRVDKRGKAVEINADNLYKRLKEVLEARGKKNTDRAEQVNILQRLLAVASSPYQKIRVLLALISSQFDYNLTSSGYMNIDYWKAAEKEINQLLQILEDNADVFVVDEDVEELEIQETDPQPPAGKDKLYIRGSLISYVDRLDDEFTRSLQNIDPHTTDYVERLKDETGLYAVIVRCQAYFQLQNLEDNLYRVVMRRLEHLYYKPDSVVSQVELAVKALLPANIAAKIGLAEPSDLLHDLCVVLYKQNNSLLRTRAMLCHIYHHALHNRYYKARDMLLMSHLQESIHQADVGTQILHNRAMVQVGLCAFREGMIKEAQSCLQEICGSGRPKELLAQGLQLQRYAQLPPEQEKLDRQRQLPFHMHINLELLECVYLTCSMLLEIPSMAAAGPSAPKKIISKPFRRLLEYNERQVFTGPPENTRDHIMGAAKALASGEWERARDLIMAIKIWDLMPEAPKIKEMLAQKIQEEGLRTYLFTYSSYYSTLGLGQLANMFSLPSSTVTGIISKMIWNEEISGALDQVNHTIVLFQVEPSRVQTLALQFADKAAALVEANERVLEGKNELRTERDKGTDRRTKAGPNSQQNKTQGSRNTIGYSRQTSDRRNNFSNVLGNSVRGRGQQRRQQN